jgi:hypothetical protein
MILRYGDLVRDLATVAIEEKRPGWQELAEYVCRQVEDAIQRDPLEYRPCTCDGHAFPHRPGSGGCKMPKAEAKMICKLRVRPRRYTPCTCAAYDFPHRPDGGRCSQKRGGGG